MGSTCTFSKDLKSCFLNKFNGKPSEADPPTVQWLIQHREELDGLPASTRGATPTAFLYRMYEYFVRGDILGLRTQIEEFFNQPSWVVSAIPDPHDQDPERYAILAVLPSYLVFISAA